MTQKELKKLSRADLIEMLIELETQLDTTRAPLAQTQQALDSRAISLPKCGSIASASLLLNNLFQNAHLAAIQYVENVIAHLDAIEASASPAPHGTPAPDPADFLFDPFFPLDQVHSDVPPAPSPVAQTLTS